MGDMAADKNSEGKASFGPWTRCILHAVAVLTGLALLAGAVVAIYGVRAQPRMDGKLAVAGLASKVWVRRDEADVTHISAQSPQDVWRALGFVHAQ